MADNADAAGRTLNVSSVDGNEIEDDNVLAKGAEAVGSGDHDEGAATSAREKPPKKSASPLRTGLIIGLVILAGLGGLVGWLGFRAYQSDGATQQRELFLQVGRQGAINLTTIDFTRVDADIQRVLGSSTGAFHDDFQKRSPAFAEVVKNAQSKTEGSV
ncbi:MAG: Mce protein, partial [Mycobacterium sp.]